MLTHCLTPVDLSRKIDNPNTSLRLFTVNTENISEYILDIKMRTGGENCYLLMNRITAEILMDLGGTSPNDEDRTAGVFGFYEGCKIYIDEDYGYGTVRAVLP